MLGKKRLRTKLHRPTMLLKRQSASFFSTASSFGTLIDGLYFCPSHQDMARNSHLACQEDAHDRNLGSSSCE